jgi:hypothetical protein
MAKLTKAQRARLDKLATYLEGLPEDYEHFEMRTYFGRGGTRTAADYARNNGGLESCGTAACALGHGPAAGILVPPRLVGHSFVSWNDYAALFVGNYRSVFYDWLFADDWGKLDNTHWGAAARIRYLLANGLPADFCDDESIGAPFVKLYAPYRIDAKTPAREPSHV